MTRPAKPAPEYTTSAADGDGYWAGVRLRVARHRGAPRVEWWNPVALPEVTRGGEIGHQWEHQWERAPLGALTRHYGRDSALWAWLGSHGIERAVLSGPSGQRVAPRAARVDYRPSAGAWAVLERLERETGEPRNAVLDRCVLGAAGR